MYSNFIYANRPPLATGAVPRPATAYQADVSEINPDETQKLEPEQPDAQGNYANEPSSFDYEYENESANQYFVTPIAEVKPFVCRVCSEAFTLKNRLHYHLGSRGLDRTQAKKTCSERSATHTWNKQIESKNEFKSINIKLDIRSSFDEASAHLNDTPSMKVTPIIEFNADFFKDIDIDQIYRE